MLRVTNLHMLCIYPCSLYHTQMVLPSYGTAVVVSKTAYCVTSKHTSNATVIKTQPQHESVRNEVNPSPASALKIHHLRPQRQCPRTKLYCNPYPSVGNYRLLFFIPLLVPPTLHSSECSTLPSPRLQSNLNRDRMGNDNGLRFLRRIAPVL